MMALRMAPLSRKEQEQIRGEYRAGDAFRNAKALGEKYNVAPEDISDVVTFRYQKGKKS